MRNRWAPKQDTFDGGQPGVVEPIGFDGDDDPCPYSPEVQAAVLAVDMDAPTHFKPGSQEKIYLMQRRLAHGCPLFIEGDVTDHAPTETRRELFEVSPDVDDSECW